MKKLILILIVGCLATTAGAQTWSEWFRQKKTQIKYLVTQIAAYKVFASSLQKGYGIAKEGLGVIGQIKRGDFTLHGDHFSSRVRVNPAISGYWKVKSMSALQAETARMNSRIEKGVGSDSLFSGAEKAFVKKITGRVRKECFDLLTAFQQVVTDEAAEMTDDARIARVDVLYNEMLDKRLFLQSFKGQLQSLRLLRLREGFDVQTGKSLFNLH